MRLSTIALIVVLPINVALNIVLVHHTNLGFLGAPVAMSISYWLCFIILVLLTAYSPTHHKNGTWGGLQLREALIPKAVLQFLKLAVPGIIMVGTEWYVLLSMHLVIELATEERKRLAFEIVALLAGTLGPLPLAAQSVIMTTDQSQRMPRLLERKKV